MNTMFRGPKSSLYGPWFVALSVAIALLLGACVSYTRTQSTSKWEMDTKTWHGLKAQAVRAQSEGETKGILTSRHESKIVRFYSLDDSGGSLGKITPGTQPDAIFASLLRIGSPRERAIQLLVYWGAFFLDNPMSLRLSPESDERALGMRLLLLAFAEFTAQLKGTRNDSVAAMIERQQGGLPGEFLLPSVRSAESRRALGEYARVVWDRLPTVKTGEQFMARYRAAECLKTIYSDQLGDETTAPGIGTLHEMLQFFATAAEFHQQAPPGDRSEPFLQADVVAGGIRAMLPGYGRIPGEPGLQPLSPLVETDLVRQSEIVNALLSRGALTKAEAQTKMVAITHQMARFQARDLKAWRQRAERVGDRPAVFRRLLEEYGIHRQQGNLESAKVSAEAAALVATEIGDRPKMLTLTVGLAGFAMEAKQWETGLQMLRSVYPGLLDADGFGEVDGVTDAYDAEYEALKQLGRGDEVVRLQSERTLAIRGLRERIDRWQNLENSLENAASPARRKEILEAAKVAPDWSPFLALKIEVELINILSELGELKRAAALADGLRPEIRRLLGPSAEKDLLGRLVDIHRRQNDYGRAVDFAREYETLARKISGDNWRHPHEYTLARIYHDLDDLGKAEEALAAKTRHELNEVLASPLTSLSKAVGVEDMDLLLVARIQLKKGETRQARELVGQLTANARAGLRGGPVVDERKRGNALQLLPELAEIQVAMGQPKEALMLLEPLLKHIDPREDVSRWTAHTIRAGELALQAGQNPTEIAGRFEAMIPGLHEYPELDAANPVRMDIFLGEYYRKAGDFSRAQARLDRALPTAKSMGLLDEQIAIHRLRGEVAREAGQMDTAIEAFGTSIALLRSVSEDLRTDTNKIGYREARARAIPLLALTHHDRYLQTKDPAAAGAMLTVAEEGKSRALVEMLIRKAEQIKTGPVDIALLQAALPANALLIEYYVPEGVADTVFRFEVDRENIHVARLDITASQLDRRAEELRDLACRDADYDEKRLLTAADALAAALLPGSVLNDESASTRVLYVVPTGNLHLVPFFLLTDGKGKFLDDRRSLSIVHLPSAAMLLRHRPAHGTRHQVGAFINPALEREQHQLLAERPELRLDLETALSSWADAKFTAEIRLTPAQFLAAARSYENVFVCAHARFMPATPMLSYIKFAAAAGDNGRLEAEDLVTEKLGRGLWAIAGCSTATGRVRSGGEVLGLPRALLLAGTTMVVVSLWDVDTARSLQTMASFYRGMAAGMSVAEALHAARSEIRKASGKPFDWAPFILIGFHDFSP